MSSIYITLEKRKNCETVDIWCDLTIIKFEPVLIRKKAWLEIGFLDFKFLSTAGKEAMVISAIQNKNTRYFLRKNVKNHTEIKPGAHKAH